VGVLAALGISAHAEDLDRLREIFSRMNWKLQEARSCHEAAALLCLDRMPVIICDYSFADGNWKDILSLTAPLLESPRVIVMSGSVEASWTSEVLDMGGYGVLAKPLDNTQVTHVLVAAYRSWLTNWPGRPFR
jgi:DNA-binding NtrC family response regulator